MKLGIDIGGTSIKFGILDKSNNLILSDSLPTDAHLGPDSLQEKVKSIINKCLSDFPLISSIGVGVPGVVDDNGTVLIAPNLTGWANIPFGEFLRSEFALPVRIDNDANAAALTEMQLGAGAMYKNFL